MAEIDKTAEARRKAQRNGEEDPVVIAQRFLNIYRQMHIFSPERRAAFDKMLLELPADIRGLFGALPGGILLQDYVDDLAEKAGVTRSSVSTIPSANTANIDDEEVSKAKILATALAEAQVQASAKMQTSAFPTAGTAQVVSAPPSQITLDKDFSKVFATTLADALQKNNASQKDDIREIIKSLGQTQMQIVKVLQDESSQQRMEMKNIFKAISENDTKSAHSSQVSAAPSPNEDTTNLVKILANTQQQLAQRISKVENMTVFSDSSKTDDNNIQQLSNAILESQENFNKTISALSESNKNSTMEIAKLINESQQQMMSYVEAHNTHLPTTINEESQNLIKVLANVQQQLAQRISKIENSTTLAPTPDISNNALEKLSQAILDSREDFNKTINFLGERQKSDSKEIAKLISDSQQQMMNFIIQHNTLYQHSANTSASSNNANNIQINTADYSQQLNQIMNKLTKLEKNNKNKKTTDATDQNSAPFVMDNENISQILKDVVMSQSQLYREMAKAQTEEIGSIISLALKENQKISTQSIINALGRQPIVLQDAANVAYQATQSIPPSEFVNESSYNAQSDFDNELLFELNNDSEKIEESLSFDDYVNSTEAEIANVSEMDTEKPAPLKKKKKKKKKKNPEITVESQIIEEENLLNNTQETIQSIDDEQQFADNFDSETNNNLEDTVVDEKSIYSSDAIKAMVPNAPPMPDIADDIDLELDEKQDDNLFNEDDDNLGVNWLGNIEETPKEEIYIADFDTDKDISADDWGFSSYQNDDNAVYSENSGQDNLQNEDWVWEYVEENSDVANSNYGNDNLEPILQQSVIYGGECYKKVPSFEKVTISANPQPITSIYDFNLKDSAKSEIEDEPY